MLQKNLVTGNKINYIESSFCNRYILTIESDL